MRLRTTGGDEYDVVVGLVDGYAGSVRVQHAARIEVFDSASAPSDPPEPAPVGSRKSSTNR